MMTMAEFDRLRLVSNTRAWLRGRDVAAPDGDPALFRSGRPGAFHNGVSRLAGADIGTAIADARAYFHGMSWLWWCGDDSRPGVAVELTGRGATPAFEMPVMAARLEDTVATRNPRGSPSRRSRRGRRWRSGPAYQAGMSTEPEDFGAVLHSEQSRSDAPGTYRRFLGRVDSRGVATSALLLTDEVAGLYVVGVDPLFRNRGYGTAMSAAALATARLGRRGGSAHAAGAGQGSADLRTPGLCDRVALPALLAMGAERVTSAGLARHAFHTGKRLAQLTIAFDT